jgi:hypothetical protein
MDKTGTGRRLNRSRTRLQHCRFLSEYASKSLKNRCSRSPLVVSVTVAPKSKPNDAVLLGQVGTAAFLARRHSKVTNGRSGHASYITLFKQQRRIEIIISLYMFIILSLAVGYERRCGDKWSAGTSGSSHRRLQSYYRQHMALYSPEDGFPVCRSPAACRMHQIQSTDERGLWCSVSGV